jgi:CheY-like chemotaxis protein
MPQSAHPALPLPPNPGLSVLGQGLAIPPRTLLLVEDSRLAAEAVRLLCRRAGLRLRRAETLASAVLHLKVYRPDIVLVDLGLPDGSGLALIAALARQGERPRRIVAISGDAAGEAAALGAGADQFLLKPVSMARHLAALTGDTPSPAADLRAMDRVLGLEPPGPKGDRNAGADPLALRDDLRRVLALLSGSPSAETLRYVAQFLLSVGRMMRDDALTEAARNPDPAMLRAMIEARLTTVPVF